MRFKKGDLLLFDPPLGSMWLVLDEKHEGRDAMLAMQVRLANHRPASKEPGTLYVWNHRVIKEWVEKGYVTCISGEEKSDEQEAL